MWGVVGDLAKQSCQYLRSSSRTAKNSFNRRVTDCNTCILMQRVADSSPDTPNLIDEALRFCQQQSAALRKAATTSSTTKAVSQSVTSSSTNHQDSSQRKPTATVAPQKRRDESITANTADEKNGLIAKEQKASEKPGPRAQVSSIATRRKCVYHVVVA